MRKHIEIISLIIFMLSVFTWLLTGFEMLFIPAKELMVVMDITKNVMLISMLIYMISGNWKSIRRTWCKLMMYYE